MADREFLVLAKVGRNDIRLLRKYAVFALHFDLAELHHERIIGYFQHPLGVLFDQHPYSNIIFEAVRSSGGVTSEDSSLAGKLKLGQLIYLYDSNEIQIEGSIKIESTEEVAKRF